MSSEGKFKTFFSRRPALDLAFWLLLAVGLVCLATVGLRIVKGPHWPPRGEAAAAPMEARAGNAGGVPGEELTAAPQPSPGSAAEPAGSGIRDRVKRAVAVRHPGRVLLVAAAAFLLAGVVRKGPGHTRREWMIFAGRMILFAVSLGLSVAIGEIGIRAILLQRQKANSLDRLAKYQRGEPVKVRGSHPLCAIIGMTTNENLIYDLRPNLDMDFGHRRLRTNRDGMRESRDYSLDRQTHSVRIVGVGDSGMFGWNVHQDQDYLSVLESNLNSRADGVLYEVLNMAVPGYNTAQELELAATKGLAYKPDIVIVGWCNNDFDLPFCATQTASFTRKDVSFLYLLLFNREKLRDICYAGVADRRTYDPNRIPKNLVEMSGVEGATYCLKRAKKLSEEQKFHFLIFGPLTRQMVGICRELGLDSYNTYEQIPPGKYPKEYAVHFFHPRADGHRVLAEHLETFLRDRGWLQPSAGKN